VTMLQKARNSWAQVAESEPFLDSIPLLDSLKALMFVPLDVLSCDSGA